MKMLSLEKHKVILIKILKEIYTDPLLRTALGFKGGTAAYLFYGLTRFSTDLDFDLLDVRKKQFVFEKVKKILSRFGRVTDAVEKRFTLFFLLVYTKGQRNIKVEISKRETVFKYIKKSYLGLPVLTAEKHDILAGKISAILTRNKFAARDFYDLWFFLKEGWRPNEESLKKLCGLTEKKALKEILQKVLKIKKSQLMSGIGELLETDQKKFVKENLKDELIFYIRLYLRP